MTMRFTGTIETWNDERGSGRFRLAFWVTVVLNIGMFVALASPLGRHYLP